MLQAIRAFHNPAVIWVLLLLPGVLGFWAAAEALPRVWTTNEEKEPKKPFAGDPAAIKEGNSIFRARCALCHGTDARGGAKGPDLTSGHLVYSDNDAALFRTITEGIEGTQMPANDLTREETWKVIAYLRSRVAASPAPDLGSRQAGEKIFFGKGRCFQCHMVKGRGGRLGPDLSRVGNLRSVRYLRDKIREPTKASQEITVGLWWELGQPLVYQSVIAVTKDGQQITGALRNEDTFSIQLMDQREELRMFLKKDLQQVIHNRGSLMPEYNEEMLSEKEVQDLLAYLSGLRGP